MPAKIAVTGIILVCFLALVVYMVELFIPISAGSDFKTECRNTLLKMELEGGLSAAAEEELKNRLILRGMSSMTIDGTESASLGEDLILSVQAEYRYSSISGIFAREDRLQKFRYDKRSISRVVVN
jgi:hypothetical protein